MHNEEYRPHSGDNRSAPRVPGEQLGTYANLDLLQQRLLELLSSLSEFSIELEEELTDFALSVGDFDPRLQEAHGIEWPQEKLGEPRNQVSYRYYKALGRRNSTSAIYIRRRFEEAVRDVTGTAAHDLLSLASLMRDEALLIQEFLNGRIQQVDDTSEHRTLELFQDWTESALGYTRKLRAFYAESKTPAQEQLPSSEVGRLTPSEAKQAQALFKVKLNALNDDITRYQESLKSGFTDFAAEFYGRLLGPALSFRLKDSDDSDITRASESQLRSALADQMRRNLQFSKKIEEVDAKIRDREKYRSYIKQLATKGKPIPVSGPRAMQRAHEKPEEVVYWDTLEGTAGPSLKASHQDLIDRDGDPHPQYLLQEGGTLQGDLVLADDVNVDGLRPSTHRHTGDDGSFQVSGADLIPGSLHDEVVSSEGKPPVPYDLRTISHRDIVIPPGTPRIDSLIDWKGRNQYRYEVQLTVLDETTIGGGIDPVLTDPGATLLSTLFLPNPFDPSYEWGAFPGESSEFGYPREIETYPSNTNYIVVFGFPYFSPTSTDTFLLYLVDISNPEDPTIVDDHQIPSNWDIGDLDPSYVSMFPWGDELLCITRRFTSGDANWVAFIISVVDGSIVLGPETVLTPEIAEGDYLEEGLFAQKSPTEGALLFYGGDQTAYLSMLKVMRSGNVISAGQLLPVSEVGPGIHSSEPAGGLQYHSGDTYVLTISLLDDSNRPDEWLYDTGVLAVEITNTTCTLIEHIHVVSPPVSNGQSIPYYSYENFRTGRSLKRIGDDTFYFGVLEFHDPNNPDTDTQYRPWIVSVTFDGTSFGTPNERMVVEDSGLWGTNFYNHHAHAQILGDDEVYSLSIMGNWNTIDTSTGTFIDQWLNYATELNDDVVQPPPVWFIRFVDSHPQYLIGLDYGSNLCIWRKGE